MTLILMGFQNVGKSTYGKKLAGLLKREFIDTDQLIEELYLELGHPHSPAYKIHDEIGEKAFRKLEEEALKKLKINDKAVIALGGGTVINPESVDILRHLGQFVYLSKDKDEIKKLLQAGRIPSYLDPDNFDASFQSMYNERRSLFQSLATYTIDTSKHKETEVLAKLYEIAFKG